MRIAGLVLAGGRSLRFGSEKAVALLDGEPLLAHVARSLAAGCEAVAVNASPGSEAAAWAERAGLRILADDPRLPDGPLNGVMQGLRWASRLGVQALATAPCDTPGLPHDMVARLEGGLADAPAAYAQTAAGSHPLCAVWRVETAAVLEPTLTHGHPSVRAWHKGAGGRAVTFGEAAAFANVNTPEDLARL